MKLFNPSCGPLAPSGAFRVRHFLPVCLLATLVYGGPAWAEGMMPESTVVLVDEADREASIKVTNSDKVAGILHVRLVDIPEDPEPLLVVTPPVARVEAGQQQLVRFILTGEALKTQRLKRVIIEGLPAAADQVGEGANVTVNMRQNLPVILHPIGLAEERQPWTQLALSVEADQLLVANPSPYVVRLAQGIELLPSSTRLQLPRSYVLPGETLKLYLPKPAAGDSTVRLHPSTLYGFAAPDYDAPLGTGER